MVKSEGNVKMANRCKRVNHYSRVVFEIITASGSVKFTKLQPVVKALLSVASGNTSVERPLSDNKNTVTCERSNLI